MPGARPRRHRCAPASPTRQWYPSYRTSQPRVGRAGRPRHAAPGPAGRELRPARADAPRWGRIALVAGVSCWSLALLGRRSAPGCYTRSSTRTWPRTDPFSEITGGRPGEGGRRGAQHPAGRQRLAGPGRAVDKPGEWRADTMIIMHIPAEPREGLPGLHPARPVRARSRRARTRPATTAAPREDQRGVRVGRPAADRTDRRVLHRRPHRPRDG